MPGYSEIRPEFTLFAIDSGSEILRICDHRTSEPLFDIVCRSVLNYVDIKLSYKAGYQFSVAHFDDSAKFISLFSFSDDRNVIENSVQNLQRSVPNQRRQQQLRQQQQSPEVTDIEGFSFSSVFSWLNNVMSPSKLLLRIIVLNARQSEPFVDSHDRVMKSFLSDTRSCIVDFLNVTDEQSPDGSNFLHALWNKIHRLGNVQLYDVMPEQLSIYDSFARLLPHPDFMTGHSHDNGESDVSHKEKSKSSRQ